MRRATTFAVLAFSFAFAGRAEGQTWEMVWADEFSAGTRPDLARWGYEYGAGGWGNNELQNYTARSVNVRVDSVTEGKLIIEAWRDWYQNVEYSSGRIFSKQSWTYGKFEFRAKLPPGRGTWPALWLLPVSKVYGNALWPDNGEIDVMESVGYDPNRVHCSIHCKNYNGLIGNTPSNSTVLQDVYDTYHTYVTEWTPHEIRSYADGALVLRYLRSGGAWQRWPFNQPFALRLNVAVGGNWGGQQGVDPNAFPTKLQVDWIRVYRAASTPFGGAARTIPGKIEAEDFDEGGEGFAYHDADTSNQGGSAYRTGGVDIAGPATDGTRYIGWVAPDEWWNYTIQLSQDMVGTLAFRVASIHSGKSFYVELDDRRLTPDLAVPNTGSWTSFQEVKVPRLRLPAGTHRLRVIANTDLFNFDSFRFAGAPADNSRR